jgi:two-component system OmpR family response regulator
VGEIRLDCAGRAVTLADAPVDLTAREYALLEAMMRRAGRILSRSTLEQLLYSFEADVSSNTVEVHVASLRRKLGHGVIETVRGMGYRLTSTPT